MKQKKLKIDLNKQDIPEEIKAFIVEQSKLIEKLKNRLNDLEKENIELKKNFS